MSHDPDYYFKEYGLPAMPDLSINMLQLDPADRAVHRIADQRDAVQKKTFTKWVNKHLLKAGRRIVDLFEGFKDGHNLLSLLEVLSSETLPRERGRMKFHQIQNVQIALEFLRRKGIRLVNIRSDEIVDGNPKLTLGLVWTIILHFQISDVVVPGQPEDISAKDALLLWSRRTTDGYPGVQVRDFDQSWRDGKAFLSIIHRNRPNLIDFRRVQSQTNRQNLELAFSTAEKEFGVTRLLDPEDVDVPKPDEKSIITYVSSLYDVFPDVPSVEQSLKDNELQLKAEEYKELVVPLVAWLQEVIMTLSQRNFPLTLIEMKSLLSDVNRFKMEDVPPRLEMRKRALRLFDEIQSSGASQLASEDELYPDNVNRLWHRFESALQDRDRAIQQEIIRLERLQRLAEKVHRESKNCEDCLNDVERRITEEEHRIDSLHPFEVKRNCDALDRALKSVEENVRSLLRDAQALQDGRYTNADNIYRRVSALQTRTSQLRTQLFNSLIQKIISKSYVEEGITTTRKREVITEVRLVESNPAFQHIQQCLNWIESKQTSLQAPEFGSDLTAAQMSAERCQQEHAEITGFKKQIDKCIRDRLNLSADEQDLYTEWLSKVEVAYSLLHNNSIRRVKCVESLMEFLQAATQELMWLHEREELEVTRDWSSSRLNIPAIEDFYKGAPIYAENVGQNLLHEMKARETQFNSVQDRGNSLVLDRHPASRTIESYMGSMQSQWSWLLQLSVCLEAHVKNTTAYYQYFEDCHECEQWMSRQADDINIRYSDEGQSVELLQTHLRELQEISDQVSEYERRVSSITLRSRDIIPLKQRSKEKQPTFAEIRCRCLCIYKQPPMMLNKGEEITLLDNNQKIRWRVRNSSGQEDLIPSVCVLIPPPNYEAIEYADRLKIQLDHLQSLLRLRKRKLRHNIVLGTIQIVRGWDLATFQGLDPMRREALLRALNDDATKLIGEVGEGDRDMRQLRDRLADCNQHFNGLVAAAGVDDLRRTQGPDRQFLQRLDSVSFQLSSLDQDLQARVQQPLPYSRATFEGACRQQQDWERALQNQEGPVEHVKVTVRSLATRSPQLDSKVQSVSDTWEQMITLGNTFAESLKLLDTCISKQDNIATFLADQEVALTSQQGMNSDLGKLQGQIDELQAMSSALKGRQSILDSLQTDTDRLRASVALCRPGTSRHHDVEDNEKRVSDLRARWDTVKEQVQERLVSIQEGCDSLGQYLNGFHEEEQFVAQTQSKINSQPAMNGDLDQAKKLVNPTMALYNSLGEHQHQIEAVNRHGGLYIREAKIYEKKLQQFQERLQGPQGAQVTVDGVRKRARKTTGADALKNQLDNLNRQYIDQVLWANRRLQEIKDIFSANNIAVHFPTLVTDEVPLLRTFRAELTKRSSMLVDEDMQEYFTQLADFEGYGGLQAMGHTGQMFGSQTAVNVSILPETAMRAHSASVSVTATATATASPSPVKWRLKPAAVSMERLSNKVASISSLTGAEPGSFDVTDSADSSQSAQTLITVKQGCLAPKGTYLNVVSILNPSTGRKVTLADAIKLGVYDSETGTVYDSRIKKRMNVTQAVANKYLTSDLMRQLTATCGICDPYSGNECTLLEAIQKGLFNPTNNSMKDPKTGTFITLQEAVARGLMSHVDMTNLIGEGETVTFITQAQAVFSDSDLGATTMTLGLGDLLESGLYNPQTGKVLNPLNDTEITLIEAVEMGLVNPTRKEIKDASTGKMMTLSEAVNSGIIDPQSGMYLNKSSGQKHKLDDAYQRKLIVKLLLLPEAMQEGAILDDGMVMDMQTGRTMSFKNAIELGVIDANSKTIVDSKTGDVLSVTEAIEKGLMDIQGTVHVNGKSYTLTEALNKGLIKLVKEQLSFSQLCVQDTRSGTLISIPQAFKQGIITSNGDFVDTASGRRILLKAASAQGLVTKEAYEMLTRGTSMKDSSGRNISVLKAVQIGMLRPEKAEVKDPKSGQALSLQQAAKEGIISTEDAQLVFEWLTPAIAHTTVTTRLKPGQQEAGIRSISVSDAVARGLLNEQTGTFRDPNTGASMPVKTAIERGLLRLSSQWPPEVSRKPSDQVDSVSSAEADIERWVREIKSNPEMSQQLLTTGKATVEAKLARRKSGDGNFSFTQTVVTKPKVTEHVVSETKHFKVKSVVDPRTKTEISVNEAIHRGLLDMSKGLFIHPITEERMSIESALSRGFVRGVEASEPSQGSVKETKAFSIVGVIHPRTGQKIPVSQAVKEGILDLEQGLYCGVDSKGKIQKLKISEAVEKGFVVTDDDSSIKGSGGIVHETRTYQLKSVYNPKTKQKIDVADAIKQGLIDESKGLYIHPFSGEKFSIPEAIEKKLIEAELMSVISNQEGEGSKIITTKQTTLMVKFVVDPRTGEHLSITKAVDEGILDGKMEKYINPMTGEVISLNEAIDKKLVITQQAAIDRSSSSSTESIHIGNEEEIVESSMVEEISSETVTFSINSVIDPRTMEMMSYDDAIRYGVLDVSRGLYRNPLTGETTPINVALEKGLIHGEVTSKVKEEDKLLSTVNASNSSFPFKKISSVVDQSDGSEISLIKAVKDGIIDVENGTYFDVNTVQNIPLELALKKGYIKLSKATDASDIERMQIKSDRKASEREQRRKSTDSDLQSTVDMKMEKFNVSGQKGESAFADEVLNYSTAVEDKDERKGPLELHQQQGVRTWRQQEMAVVDNQSASSRSDSPIEESLESLPLTDGMSFQSAMKLGLIDARSGRIRDPDTKKYITIQEAIDKDVLEENKPAMRDILTGQSLTLRQCIDKGIIDPRTGKVNDKKAKAEKVAFRPDIDVKQTRPKPLNLLDTVATGLFDPNTGMITDPRSQRSYTLKEALAQHIIDGNLVSVLDRQTGDRLTLEAAVKQGIMDGVTAEVTTHLGERLPLMQAIQDGLVDNVFDKETSKFHDTLTGTDVPLEKALTEGHIRSTEAQVFDTSTGDVIPLDVAFKKGLVDVRTGEVTDKVTGKKMSPKEALKLGLLAIVGAPVLAGKAVYDAIKENSETERKLAEKKQFSPRPPVVAVNGNSPRSPVAAVNGNGYSSTEFNGSQAHRVNGVTPVNGDMHLQHTENVREVLQQPRTTIIFAKPGDQIRPSPPQSLFTEPASSMEYKAADRYTGQLSDSHDKLVSDLHNELNWVSDVEQLLKDDQPVSEEAYKAQSQREVLKALYDDVLGHQQPIRSLVYQSEQLVEHHQEELTPEQVTELQNLESVMKTSYGKVQKTCESRMKHLSTATDELTKFEAELKKFSSWLGTTEQELQRQIEAIQIVDGVTRVKDQHKEMQSDIIAHTADLRYLSYPLKTYMEEAKAHKLELDAYKADRAKPSRMSRTSFISMDNKEVEVVLEKQKEAETRYNELKSECNKFGDKLTALVNKQKTFNESTWTMLSWLTDTEEKLSMTRQESSAPEPEALREALEKMKVVGNDTIAHKNQMAELEKCGKEVITQMAELGIHGEQIAKIQEIIDDIAGRHDIISEEVNEKANELQTAVTKSQDVQDAVENLLTWLKDTDRKLDLQKLVSLNQEKLKEQEQQLSIIEKDIESHQPSVESVKLAARELIKTCDLDMAKALEGKINDISTRFLGVQKKSRSSLAQVNTVSEGLQRFNENLDVLRAWVQINTDSLESSEWSKKPIDQLKNKVDAVKLEKDRQMQAVLQLKTTGQNLIQDPRTSDPNAIKMALANMDQLWAKFEECLNERDAEASLKESRESDYERMKDEVVRWLSAMETSVDAFEPVAVDMDIVSRQIEELQPMIQEHYEFSPRIDELNTVGNAYDAIQAGDSRPKSPMRFRTRRYPSSMTSPRIRSPSPTTGSFPFGTELTSPMSASSDSSGVGSRKSSSDFLHLDDLSETQQDLVDMNQRYEMLEERLLDRQQELKGMLDTVKSFLQDLADVLSWLDARERDLDVAVAVATSEKEAKRRLKEHERSHAEVLAKETLVEDIRRKGQDLIKRKRGVPGIDMVQQQLSELDDKWLGVKVASEQQRKLLEDIVSDLRTYKDAGVHLQKWIAQKDKMVAVLGPVATEPSMIKNQLEQVKVLQEEMKGQEPLYDKFIQSGNAVHDKCVPDSQDAAHISEKMTVISKSWEKLGDKLRERESSLNSVEELSQNFSDTLQYLTAWLGDYMTTLDQLPPVASSPEKHKEHLKEIHELESERKKHVPILDQAKEIAKKLADNTKDANTKFEIKNKIASIEKPMFEAERKLQTRSNDLSKVSEQGAKLLASCQDLVALLGDLEQKAAKNEPVSGDPETLKVQVQKNKDMLQNLNNLTPEIKALQEQVRQFGDTSSPEIKALLETSKTIEAKWEALKEAANQRDEQLEASTKHTQNFQAQLDKMLLWLQLSEGKLDSLTPDDAEQTSIARKLKEAKALEGDMRRLVYDHELLNQEGQSLMETVDSDKGPIRVRLEDMNQRWENLNEGLSERVQGLEELSSRLTEFEDCSVSLQQSLQDLEERLDAHNKLGSSAKDPLNKDKIKAMKAAASALDSQLDYLDGLLVNMEDADGTVPAGKVEAAKQRQAYLQHQIAELLHDMEVGTQIVDQFQNAIQRANSDVSELDTSLKNLGPIGREETILQRQKRETEEFISKVNDLDNMLDDLESQYDSLKADGYVTPSGGLKAQLDQLRNQQEKLREKSEERLQEVQTIYGALEGVTDNLRRMRTSIDRASDELEMHEPIGTDVNAIKRLQDELKQFQHGVLENLSKRVAALTMDAQGLIQGAAPGVDTAGLESDLDSLRDKWNSLNSKVSERDRNLDNAILQSGKFNDALRNLIDWMKETEDLVANQKPPSPDYKVAKAQLQEQKFLLKMLDDRAPNVKSVKESGETLQLNLEAKERQAIKNQTAQLDKRWSDLNFRAEQRSQTLENIVGIAQEFQEVREPLVGWLDGAEKRFASLEPSTMDADNIEKIIKDLVDLGNEMNLQDEKTKKLALIGKELQNHCKGDDVKNVQRKIDDIQTRYGELSDKLTDILEQMEEALPLAKNFNETHAKFIDWLVKMEPKTKQQEGNESEDQVSQLLEEMKEIEPLLTAMIEVGEKLSDLAPGDAGFKVEDTVAKDKKRFEAINEAVQAKADKYRASKLKNAEVMCTIDDLLEWFTDEQKLLQSCESISCDPAHIQKQLAEQKAINDDINAQKAKARDTIATGKRLIREGSVEDETGFNGKIEHLKQQSDTVAKLGTDRLVQLEQALPMSRTFKDAHQDLVKWFQEVEPIIAELAVMSINQDTVKKQQDKIKILKQDLQDNKPLMDKLNKTGLALTKLALSPVDVDLLQETMENDNRRVEDIRRGVRERSMSIDEALQQSAEFTDKLENMLEALTSTEEQVTNAQPVSAHPDKIRDQISDNNALMEEMTMRLSALESVQVAAEELIKQATDSQDDAVKDVKAKLLDLCDLYERINAAAAERNNRLEETLEVSDRFWDELHQLTRSLKDLSDTLASQDPPALEPSLIKEQQETLEALRENIEETQFDLGEVQQTGEQLMNLCGEPDRPEVQKNIDDLDTNLRTINSDFEKRSRSLEDALERSLQFQDELMKNRVWLQKREDTLRDMGPIGGDFDTIKEQWNKVKNFKLEVDPKHADIEALNQKAEELVKDSSPDQVVIVKEPVGTVNKRWEGLQEGISDRQRELQLAMLNLGQTEHALNELLAWLDKTEQMLDENSPVLGDRKLVEIELAKHKVLQNDIHSREPSVRSVREACQMGSERSATSRRKVDDMMRMWNTVQGKSKARQQALEEALKEAKSFSDNMEKMIQRLGQIEGMLITSRPVGGLPDTARDQLDRFMEVHNELQDMEPAVARLQQDGARLIAKSMDPASGTIKQNLQRLQATWEHVKTRSVDRKDKLEQAVNQANNFHGDLSEFTTWLLEAENTLNNMSAVSRVIPHVSEQIMQHKTLQQDIATHRDQMIKLDKTGTHLKYFSQKPDVVIIKNLLSSVQQRWEKIVSRSAERTRHLERGYKEAKQFSDMLGDLMGWLTDAEEALTNGQTIGNDPIKIKVMIAKHKEFQKSLGSKQPVYDNVNRTGRSLKERSPDQDMPVLDRMLSDLKHRWNNVCGKSVDRQRKLEEALLFSGQFSDALQALLDWLAKVEPGLGEDQMVHGDIDTVNNLVEEHKAFQQELGARSNNVQFVRKRAKEMLEKSEEDTSQQQAQLIELATMWDRVCKLSVYKQERLEQAQRLAEEFHKKAQGLIAWLASAERQLRYKGPLPDDEGEIVKQIEEHKAFEEEFLRQEGVLRETLNIGQDIMKRCNPDALSTLKHWLSVLRSRWEEVSNWSKQRGDRLRNGLALLRRNNQLLEELIAWLNGAETRLFNENAEPIPDDVDVIHKLLTDHQEFQNEMSTKQPEIEQVTKADRRQRTSSVAGESVSQIPLYKGLSGRRTPTPVKYGPGRRSVTDDGRRTPESNYKNPRVGALNIKWRQVWFSAYERQRRLQEALDYLNELERMKNFKFDDWRKRYLTWMHHNKSRIMDFFRRQDRDRDGKVTRQEFIEGIMASRFQTTPMEMEAVANIFDKDGDGFIDYKEFVSALRPNRDTTKGASSKKPEPVNDSEMINDEVKRQVHKCTCVKQYRIHKIGEGKYRFGDSQKLRLVRILRSTVMVRVGGGWMALDEFLVKNDPCRAKGRTNTELREQFTLATGVSQSMGVFTSKSPGGSSYSGSSTYSGATSPYGSARSPSNASQGPIMKVREKTVYSAPWRTNMARPGPDGEVQNILSTPKSRLHRPDLFSPRTLYSPGTPASCSSSRASTGSRPFSPTGSETSEISEPEVFTTVQSETRTVGGRNETTRTYQTHVMQTRTVPGPSRSNTSTPTKMSKIPKMTPKKR